MRRDFALPEEDIDFLNSCGYTWETVKESSGMWVIIQNYPIPLGYNVPQTNIAIKIDPGYPVSQIDMIYFEEHLGISGKIIRALAYLHIFGKNWQRWSRHRTGENPWRSGLDDISTHLQLVNYWLERELTK